MLLRKAMAYIKNWVDTKQKKCLIVQGASQTGKTYIIERFAEENYEELIEINFKQMPSAMSIFTGDLTVENMVMAMRFRLVDCYERFFIKAAYCRKYVGREYQRRYF